MKEPRFLISWLPRAISKELLYTNPGIGVGSEGLHVTTPSRDLLTGQRRLSVPLIADGFLAPSNFMKSNPPRHRSGPTRTKNVRGQRESFLLYNLPHLPSFSFS